MYPLENNLALNPSSSPFESYLFHNNLTSFPSSNVDNACVEFFFKASSFSFKTFLYLGSTRTLDIAFGVSASFTIVKETLINKYMLSNLQLDKVS